MREFRRLDRRPDNTTIELKGFKIECADPTGYQLSCQGGSDPGGDPDVGINTNGHNNVLIKGPGTITGFDVGVHVNGGSNVNVRKLTVTGPAAPGAGSNPRPASTGILVTGTVCPDPADTIINIHGNDASNHREGIELVDANCVNVGFNMVHDNNSDPVECHGILAVNSANNNFNNNLVMENGENLPTDGGLTLRSSGSTNNTITHNNVSDNCGDGISTRDGANNNQIVNNVALGNPNTALVTTQCFSPSITFFDLAERPDNGVADNTWNQNNKCTTQSADIPAGVCP